MNYNGFKYYAELSIDPARWPKTPESIRALFDGQINNRLNEWVPALYQESDPNRLPHQLVEAAGKWAVGSLGMGFIGATGLGKTRAMFGIIRRLIETIEIERTEHYFIAQCPSLGIINDAAFAKLVIESCSFDDGGEARKRLKQLQDCDVLFLDDIGQGKLTERVGSELYELVETRTSNLRPVLFSSNFTGKRLAEKFTDATRGDAVVRRLAEFCEVVSISR